MNFLLMKPLRFIAGVLIASFSLQAQASLLELDDAGGFVPMHMDNDFFFDIAPGYNIGGNLYATSFLDITFSYIGYEAAYNNDFNAYGQSLNNKSNTEGDSFTVFNVGPELLDFGFYSNTINLGIDNGDNQDFGAWQSFATILDFTYLGTFYDAIIMFDDSGAGPDDDHDDYIIGVNVTSVPEPSIIALFAAGLFGIGYARRRKA